MNYGRHRSTVAAHGQAGTITKFQLCVILDSIENYDYYEYVEMLDNNEHSS